jgi:hypothetical protein
MPDFAIAKDFIEVTFTARYNRPSDLEHTKVCRMGSVESSEGEHGVLLWGRTLDPLLQGDYFPG